MGSGGRRMRRPSWGSTLTLGGIGCLIVVGEPPQVEVLDPRHPIFVLFVIALFDPFRVRHAFLLVLRKAVECFLLLLLGHGVPLLRAFAGGRLRLGSRSLDGRLQFIRHTGADRYGSNNRNGEGGEWVRK